MSDEFYPDLKRFGRHALQRAENRDRKREFIWRQRQLAAVGTTFVVFFLFSAHPLFAIMATLVFITAERECRRMRAVGRDYQTKRSVEVIGI